MAREPHAPPTTPKPSASCQGPVPRTAIETLRRPPARSYAATGADEAMRCRPPKIPQAADRRRSLKLPAAVGKCMPRALPLAIPILAYLSSPHLEASPATTFRACSSPAPTPVKTQPTPAILSQESVHTTLSITHHTRKRQSTGPRTTHGPQSATRQSQLAW
jgi:hypothetical protein